MGTKWQDSELELVKTLLPEYRGEQDGREFAAKYFPGRSTESVRHKFSSMSKEHGIQMAKPPTVEVNPLEKWTHVSDALDHDCGQSVEEYIAELERKLAIANTQLTWAQHAKSDIRTGGTITHRESDCHYADANHLLSSCEQTWIKALEVFRQYEPSRINLIWGDDYVAGRGIYKNQDLDVVVSDAQQQCEIGAVHFHRRIQSLREVTSAPIHVRWLKGNHEYSNGHPLAGSLFLMVKNICDGIKDISFTLGWDKTVVNLAHDGTHNGLFLHGYGFSNLSPNSPRFISDVKDMLLSMHRTMMPHEQIQRIASGHTHQFSKDFERTIGLKWDTTGGWQRNVRVQLGFNQRPSGSIMYVSLPGMTGEILDPIGIQPDNEVYLREIEDSHLPSRNMTDSAKCLTEYQEIMESRGLFESKGGNGTASQGRW